MSDPCTQIRKIAGMTGGDLLKFAGSLSTGNAEYDAYRLQTMLEDALEAVDAVVSEMLEPERLP